MDFALTDDQRAFAAVVRDFLAGRFAANRVRAVVDDPDGDGDPADLWSGISEQGWLAVLIPEEYDGLGLGLVDAQVVARAFGAGTVPGPWLPTVLGGEAIRLAGSAAQQANWLPKVARGEAKLTVAVHQDGAGLEAEKGALTGALQAVEYPHRADRIIAATPDGTLWLVDPTGPGVQVRRHDSLDRTTRVGEVTLQSAPAEPLTGQTGQGSAGAAGGPLAALLQRAAVLVSADLVGIARTALSRTVAYDKDRVQFGVPVGSFQALKHALADLHVGVTMAEHGVLYAAHALDTNAPDTLSAVSVAKSKASDVARDTTAAMIQYHGGIGYTWEHDAHFYFKRAKREEYLYGDGAAHRERLAALLLGPSAGATR